jgi:hypothetical protein
MLILCIILRHPVKITGHITFVFAGDYLVTIRIGDNWSGVICKNAVTTSLET